MAQPPVDAQTLTDTGTYVFEAIATLEFTGRRASRLAIAAAARLDDAVLDQALTEMTRAGLLSVRQVDGQAVYTPARRGWSTQPGQAEGHPIT
ncbi:MAG: hypothetical protein ACRDOK_06250 [Streptosporangiaceae bacterium]